MNYKRIILVLVILLAIIALLFSLNTRNINENISTEYTHEIEGVKFNIPNDFLEDTDSEKEIYYDDLEVYEKSASLKVFSDRNYENYVCIYIKDLDKFLEDHNNSKDLSDVFDENSTLKRVNGKDCFVQNVDGLTVYVYTVDNKCISILSDNETLISNVIV